MNPSLSFPLPVGELVRRRRSCRSFAAAAPEPAVLAGLEAFPAGVATPFGSRLRFGIVDNERVRAANLFSAGSYGMIKGARFYLAVLVRRGDPRRWEDAGFAMEAAVLQATALGLGSCWIGGVFDRKRFGRFLNVAGDEQLPAVVAIGWAAGARTLRDRLVRWSAAGDRRKPATELFFRDDWKTPLPAGEAGKWAQVLESVRLAPSASNKQPWRIIRMANAFHAYLARDRAYSAMMPLADLQRIDMGIAMCHFQAAAMESGLDGKWQDTEPQIEGTPANFEYIVSYVIRNS